MAFDVSALSAYVKENEKQFIADSITSPATAKHIEAEGTILTEVKSTEKIGIIETDAVFQNLTGCGFNASGTTTFSQRTITPGAIKVEEALCPRDLEAKYLQKALTAGANYEMSAFAEWWVNRKIEQTASALETAIWQGDTASGTANLARFDGLQKLIAAAADEVNANDGTHGIAAVTVAGGGITTSNVDDILDAIFRALPSQLLDKSDVAVFCGLDVLRLAMIAFRNSNYFHYKVDNNMGSGDATIYVPGSNVKIHGVAGLNGTSDLYAMRKSNMFIGTDLLSDVTGVKVWYSQDDDNVKYSNKFKFGVNVGITSEVVKFLVD